MKIIFMKPKIACLSILKGVFEDCRNAEWIGPCVFNVWGLPKKQVLKSYSENEAENIFKKAEEIYKKIKNNS